VNAPLSATDPERIGGALAELERVWRRNPHKTLFQIMNRAAMKTPTFVPDEVTDAELVAGLRLIGPGLPAPH
jgi:hypothetical protein